MIDPIVIAVAAALVLVLLVTAWMTRTPRERRQPRRRPGMEVYCRCGAHATIGQDCSQCAWNRGGRRS